jgi:MFS family permease
LGDTAVETRPAAPSRAYQGYILVLLMLVYASNFADRNIIAVIQETLKHEFALADWQLGLLGGTAFALLYSVLGIPIARLAERANRVTIVSTCVGIWSFMTAFCGLANSYAMLLVGRVGVGIGEAGGSPPIHSIIANYFEQAKRAWALSVYSAGMPIGAMLAALVGGWIVQEHGWRAVFFALGVPGIILAILVKLTIREPERPPMAPGEKMPTLKATIGMLLSKGTYRHILVASVIGAFVNAGIVQFTTSFFIRTHELSLTQATFIFGVAQGIFATAGTLLGGAIVDRWKKKVPRIESWVCTISTASCGILFIIAYYVSGTAAAIGVLMVAKMAQWLYAGPSFGMMQAVAPERGRATALALYLFCTSLFGGGLGPLAIGAASDVLAFMQIQAANIAPEACALGQSDVPAACAAARADGLQIAIVAFCALYLWAAYHFWRAGDYLKREATE